MRAFHLSILAILFASVFIAGCTTAKNTNPAANIPPTPALPLQPASASNSPLKVIGLIGGVSWFSSAEYYRMMNEQINERLGDPHSARILMYSIEFADVSDEVERGNAEDLKVVSKVMVDAAKRLKLGGADFIIVGSNTMNAFDEDISANVNIPVLNIADATGRKVNESGIKKVILLGSNIVVQHDYYKDILWKKYGLAVVVPNETEQNYTNSVIFKELVVGNFKNESRDRLVQIISRLEKDEGAEGVILGCTELPLLIKQKDVNVPVFDTTAIHAEAAVDYAMGR